jgi:Uma2 family endonuclease
MDINPHPPMTVEVFEAFLKTSSNGHQFWELVDGQPVERGNTLEQGLIVSNMIYLLYGYSREQNQGRVGSSIWHHNPSDFYDVRMPKIAYYADDTRPIVTEGFTPVYPDLAVEVKAPHEDDKVIVDRGVFYLSRGTKLVWLVYPATGIIDVMTSSEVQTLRRTDILTGGNVLPNFSVSVAEIFQLDPSES